MTAILDREITDLDVSTDERYELYLIDFWLSEEDNFHTTCKYFPSEFDSFEEYRAECDGPLTYEDWLATQT